MAVGPTTWSCELKEVGGRWHTSLPMPTRRVKRWHSGAYKRKASDAAKETEKRWRRGGNGKALQDELSRRYRSSAKGKRNTALHNAPRK